MIPLEEYIKPAQLDTEVGKEVVIDNITYKIIRDSCMVSTVRIVQDNVIIKSFIRPFNTPMTLGEIYNVLQQVPEPKTFCCGDILYNKCSEKYYIIAQVDWAKINLISLPDGNRYHMSDVSITDTKNIIYDKISELIGACNILNFYYVGNAADVLTFGDDKINHKFSIEQCGAIKYILRNGKRITRGHHDFYIKDGCTFGKLGACREMVLDSNNNVVAHTGADGFLENEQAHESELISFWNNDR